MNAIEVRNLTKQFKTFKLGPLNFDIPKGAIVGFIGENGAGKTTTIKALLDIVLIDDGQIDILGNPHRTLTAAQKSKIGSVILGDEPPEILTPRQIGKVMAQLYQNWDKAVYRRYLEVYGLPADVALKLFSTGMKMKLNLAIALSHGAEVLILDEATSGLDPIARDDFLEHLQAFVSDENCTVLLSSHILSDLEKICDYYIFIQDGQIVLNQSVESLRDNYAIVNCAADDCDAVAKVGVLRSLRNQYSLKLLVDKRKFNYDGDYALIQLEELMYMLIKGDNHAGVDA